MTVSLAVLPHGVGVGALVAITFDTAVNPSESGNAGRKSNRTAPKRNYTVTIGPDDAPESQSIYNAHLGERWPIGMRDWAAYKFTDEVQAWTVTGTDTTTLSLRRKWQPATGSRFLYERILVPDETDTTLVLKINGFVPATGGPTWSLGDAGLITIHAALTGGDVVTVTGEYLTPVCFLGDLTATVHRGPGSDGNVLYSYDNVQLEQILEKEFKALLGLT